MQMTGKGVPLPLCVLILIIGEGVALPRAMVRSSPACSPFLPHERYCTNKRRIYPYKGIFLHAILGISTLGSPFSQGHSWQVSS